MSVLRLSLQNPLLTYEQLASTPSRQDAIPDDLEEDLRNLGCELIQSAGILLKMPQVAMATAQVLFQRFFYLASLKKFGIVDIGMGALFLSSKICECPVRLSYLTTVYDYLIKRTKGQENPDPMDGFSQTAYDMKNALVVAEMQILKRLGFNVHVQLPYGLMVNYLRVLNLTEHERIPNRAWSYLNDSTQTLSLRTPIHVAYPPPTVACAAIWLAARDEKVRLPESPSPWWELFDAELEEVRTAAAHVVRLYRRRLDRPILPLTSAEVERWASKEKERTREEAEAKVEAGEMMETMKVEMGEEGEVKEEEEKEARERAEATLKAVAGTGMWSGV
ncbi:cyclin-like protein [Jimgerdemannia flammicorona]|uniref:Cyclin-like protein n=1 Tax=Jimgerdemannia flammicorona TaxID=994334 RepID=A0A433QSZ1_9FUNG|nr:cyclin-like protein [Jimgerdemannia flammicorona]